MDENYPKATPAVDSQAVEQRIEQEINRISVESGVDVSELKQQFAAFNAEVGNPAGALAKLKSEHKFQLGGLTGLFTARVVGKGITRAVFDKPARGYLAVWVAVDSGQMEASPRILWDKDDVKYSPAININQVISFNGKLMPNGETTIVTSGAITPSDAGFPSVQDLVAQYGSIPLSQLDQFIGKNVFVKGVVGKTFSTPVGGGVELSEIGSNPVTVYADDIANVKDGQELIVYGYVSQNKKNDVVINARGVF